jgi:hypothetical protein
MYIYYFKIKIIVKIDFFCVNIIEHLKETNRTYFDNVNFMKLGVKILGRHYSSVVFFVVIVLVCFWW